MPFDSSTVISQADIVGSLHQQLLRYGFRGIAPEILIDHKQREIDRHPASFFFRYQHGVSVAMDYATFVGTAALFCGFVSLVEQSPLCALGFFLGVCVCWGGVIALLFANISVRGPAFWSEQRIGQREIEAWCPPAVAAMARNIHRELWNGYPNRVQFVYGELRQDEVLLDPYLIIRDETTREQVILAIWDGNTILQSAAE